MQTGLLSSLRRNLTVNIIDAGFFGLGMGLSSFIAVIPLFAATLTDSTLLIGLIAAAHTIGWQIPQLFTADMVARRRRYLPLVVMLTIHERWPYLFMGLAALALGAGLLNETGALIVLFIMVWIHGLGGGLTATAWQSMIGKIMPSRIRGTFYGVQSAGANLLASAGALLAGVLLATLPYPYNYAACFFLTAIAMLFSLGFLAATREEEHEPEVKAKRGQRALWGQLRHILAENRNFRWFMVARVLSQLAQVSLTFYAVYAVREHDMSLATAAGVMAGVMTISQTIASPFAGWLGDKYGHRLVFAALNLIMALSALLAIAAPDVTWFALVFILGGVVNAQWTTILAIAPEFSPTMSERPFYIGLMNTAVAPVTLLAPMLGGALADVAGFEATFGLSILTGIAAAVVLVAVVHNPRRAKREDRLAIQAGD
ncbi:MAG: MFS transporter [Anaerolineae bacterium]|jgi:MFS family permease|nr:MFS transporter [Anaerolineae bacterium]